MVRWPKWGKHTPDEQSQPDVAEPPAPELHFTEPAHTRLIDLMTQKGILEQGALRITVSALGFGKPEYGMALEESSAPRPDDVEFIIDGLRVLVEERNLAAVDGATVDFLDDPLRPGFSIEPPGAHQHAHPQAPPPRPRPELDLSDPLIAHVSAVIEQQVNPFIANHGGMASLIDVKDDVAYVELSGGCQGCAMAAVTLKQGVEQLVRQAVPSIREVVDVTDHGGGSNPYFNSAKGAESPFYQSAKS